MAQCDFSHATLELYSVNSYGLLSANLGFGWEDINTSSGWPPYVLGITQDSGGNTYYMPLSNTVKLVEKTPKKVIYNYTGSFKLSSDVTWLHKDRIILGGASGSSRSLRYLITGISFETGDSFSFDVVVTIS